MLYQLDAPCRTSFLVIMRLRIVDRVMHPQRQLDRVIAVWSMIVGGQTMPHMRERVIVPLCFAQTCQQRLDVRHLGGAKPLPER